MIPMTTSDDDRPEGVLVADGDGGEQDGLVAVEVDVDGDRATHVVRRPLKHLKHVT